MEAAISAAIAAARAAAARVSFLSIRSGRIATLPGGGLSSGSFFIWGARSAAWGQQVIGTAELRCGKPGLTARRRKRDVSGSIKAHGRPNERVRLAGVARSEMRRA